MLQASPLLLATEKKQKQCKIARFPNSRSQPSVIEKWQLCTVRIADGVRTGYLTARVNITDFDRSPVTLIATRSAIGYVASESIEIIRYLENPIVVTSTLEE